MTTIPFTLDETVLAELSALDGEPMRPVVVVPVGGPADGREQGIDAVDGGYVSGSFKVGDRWHDYRSREPVGPETQRIQIHHCGIREHQG